MLSLLRVRPALRAEASVLSADIGRSVGAGAFKMEVYRRDEKPLFLDLHLVGAAAGGHRLTNWRASARNARS